jgi:hypothetical protein
MEMCEETPKDRKEMRVSMEETTHNESEQILMPR